MAVSAFLHGLIIAGFVAVLLISPGSASGGNDGSQTSALPTGDPDADNPNDAADTDPDLSNPFVGSDPNVPFPSNNSNQIGDKIVDGDTDPTQKVGRDSGDAADLPSNVMRAPAGFIGLTGPDILKGALSGPGNIGDIGFTQQHMNPGDIGGRGENKAKLLAKNGGNKESEACVARGLIWFARHQSAKGYWAMDNFQDHALDEKGNEMKQRCNCEGGVLHDNVAGTAFALLTFLGAGFTPENSKKEMFDYSKQIERGLRWLTLNQDDKGRYIDRDQKGQENGQHSMYNHAIATICMCEASSLYPKDWVKKSAQNAIKLLVAVQDPNGGGWRYSPNPQPGDTSVVGWCVMALQSGRMAGLSVPASCFDKISHYLDSAELEASDADFYGYTDKGNAQGNVTMTSVGLLCRMYQGWKKNNPKLIKGADWLKKNAMPSVDAPLNMYAQYYATQVMHHMGGDAWHKEWNPKMRDILIARQDKGKTQGRPHQDGSWSPNGDQWCSIGGRVMMTALCILTLEVYYRHLPLYRDDFSDK
jgi:hypothetical protein